jgi:hypothetical protein
MLQGAGVLVSEDAYQVPSVGFVEGSVKTAILVAIKVD